MVFKIMIMMQKIKLLILSVPILSVPILSGSQFYRSDVVDAVPSNQKATRNYPCSSPWEEEVMPDFFFFRDTEEEGYQGEDVYLSFYVSSLLWQITFLSSCFFFYVDYNIHEGLFLPPLNGGKKN